MDEFVATRFPYPDTGDSDRRDTELHDQVMDFFVSLLFLVVFVFRIWNPKLHDQVMDFLRGRVCRNKVSIDESEEGQARIPL